MPATRKVIQSLAKRFIKAWSLHYDECCKKMEKEASMEQKAEILKTNMDNIEKMIKKDGLEQTKDYIKMAETQFRFMAKHGKKVNYTRKVKSSCRYIKKQGSYAMQSKII